MTNNFSYFVFLVVSLFSLILICEAAKPQDAFKAVVRAQSDSLRQQIADRMWLQVYKEPRKYDRIQYGQGPRAVLDLEQYKIDNPTVLYFPGWTENPQNKDSINYITDALLMRGDVNILIWDYSQNVQGDDNLQYLRSYINASTVGYLVGRWLQDLGKEIPNLDNKLRLVGHSMGSHIMSFSTNVYGKGRLRITALDPAYPLYIGPFAHLTAADGSFVDIIHTDSARYGHPESLGHADFFPNNGVRDQPYCKTSANNESDFCSHHMSYRYWAESAKPGQEYIFRAVGCSVRSPCNPLIPLSSCTCSTSNNNVAVMGFAAETSKFGNYYLLTSAEPPFGLSGGGEGQEESLRQTSEVFL